MLTRKFGAVYGINLLFALVVAILVITYVEGNGLDGIAEAIEMLFGGFASMLLLLLAFAVVAVVAGVVMYLASNDMNAAAGAVAAIAFVIGVLIPATIGLGWIGFTSTRAWLFLGLLVVAGLNTLAVMAVMGSGVPARTRSS